MHAHSQGVIRDKTVALWSSSILLLTEHFIAVILLLFLSHTPIYLQYHPSSACFVSIPAENYPLQMTNDVYFLCTTCYCGPTFLNILIPTRPSQMRVDKAAAQLYGSRHFLQFPHWKVSTKSLYTRVCEKLPKMGESETSVAAKESASGLWASQDENSCLFGGQKSRQRWSNHIHNKFINQTFSHWERFLWSPWNFELVHFIYTASTGTYLQNKKTSFLLQTENACICRWDNIFRFQG